MKKVLAFVLTLAMLASFVILPANAVTVASGSNYTLSTETSVKSAAKAGDTVTVRVNLASVSSSYGLLGLDLVIGYNTALVSPDGTPAAWNSGNASIAAINAAHSSAWSISGFVGKSVGEGNISITLMDENAGYAVKTDELYFDMQFTLLQDVPAAETDLFWVSVAEGCLGNVRMAYGTGCSAKISAPASTATATPKPTATPTPKPTATPTPVPTPTPAPTLAPFAKTYTLTDSSTADLIAIDKSFSYEWYGSLAGTEGETAILNMCLWQLEVDDFDDIYTWEFSTPELASTLRTTLADRDFVHVVFAVENRDAKFYVNGQLAAETTLTFDANKSPDFAPEGDFNFAHQVNPKLRIEKAAGILNIYNKAATAAQVKALYDAVKPVATPTPAPTATPTPVPTPIPVPTPKPTAAPTPAPGEKVMRYLSVNHKSDKIRYYLGEAFDPTGLVLNVFYTDGTREAFSYTELEGLEMTEPDINLTGGQSVYVTYNGFQTKFSIVYGGRADVRGLKIAKKPTKLYYKQGERFDPTGAVINAVAQDLSVVFEVPLDELTFTSFKNDEAALVAVRVFYMDYYDTSFSVRVTDEKLVSGITATKPTKVSYKVGESFDMTGMVVTAKYYDATTAVVSNSKVTVSGFDSTTPGVKTITVTYEGKSTAFSIKVS